MEKNIKEKKLIKSSIAIIHPTKAPRATTNHPPDSNQISTHHFSIKSLPETQRKNIKR